MHAEQEIWQEEIKFLNFLFGISPRS